MKLVRVAVASIAALGLVACGGGAKIGGGKQGAASAAFLAGSEAKNTQGALLRALQSGATGGEITVSCQFGGQASLTGYTASIASGQITQSFTMSFNNCGATQYDNPKTPAVEHDTVILNGSMTVSQNVNWDTTGGATGNVTQTLKGRVDYGGAFNDFIDANVKETVAWNSLGTAGGQVTVTLDGTINTSTQNYAYTNESVQITAGVMVADNP